MSGNLPYDYEIAYLEADGTQYVDTGIAIVGGRPIPDVEVDFEPVGAPYVDNSRSPIAGYTDFSVGTGFTRKYPYPARKFSVFLEDYYGDDVVYEARHVAGLKTENGVLTAYFDDEKWTYPVSSVSLDYDRMSFGLFCYGSATHRTGEVGPKVNENRMRIYSASCDGHKFVPVVKDGEACFYDTATAGLLRSQGSPFIAGPRKASPKTFLLGAKTEISTAVPYIETDGVASYMDLGFVPNSSVLKVDIDFMLIDYPYVGMTGNFRNVIYGASNGTTTIDNRSMLFIRWSSSRGQYVQFVYPSTTDESVNFGKGERIHAVVDAVGCTVTVNDATVNVRTVSSSDVDANMRLGVGYPSEPMSYSRTRFYSAKFYESGVLIRDLVPYSGLRGVGMLDKVNDVLYTNANTTGSLTYGEEPA